MQSIIDDQNTNALFIGPKQIAQLVSRGTPKES